MVTIMFRLYQKKENALTKAFLTKYNNTNITNRNNSVISFLRKTPFFLNMLNNAVFVQVKCKNSKIKSNNINSIFTFPIDIIRLFQSIDCEKKLFFI